MFRRQLLSWTTLGIALIALVGCGESPPSTDSGSAVVSDAGEATPGTLSGRVTMADGSAITAPGAKFKLTISGVSGYGERVDFNPIFKPDGTFSQKLPDGIYRTPYGTLTVKHENLLYVLPLDPVDPTGDRESAPGIVQNFVWRLTGPAPDTNVDLNNHTHWNGPTIGMRFSTWRDDIGKAPPAPPAGSKLVFNLKPLAPLLDGSAGKELTIERAWREGDITPLDSLNDLPPTSYEISGTLVAPDGSSKPLLLQSKGDYPNFKPVVRMILEPYETTGGYFVPAISWVTD